MAIPQISVSEPGGRKKFQAPERKLRGPTYHFFISGKFPFRAPKKNRARKDLALSCLPRQVYFHKEKLAQFYS